MIPIQTNLISLFAQRSMTDAQSALSVSVERLSSGMRINHAKDDAAGLGISEQMKTQVNSVAQGIRNANDAISMLQTTEGSLAETSSLLMRMKELATQGRNDSLSREQRAYIADEINSLRQEINSIADRTTFNGLSLLKNALRTEVLTSSNDATRIQEGNFLSKNLRIDSVQSAGADEGRYQLSAGSYRQIDNQASRVTAALPTTQGQVDNPAPPEFLNADFENASVTSSVGTVTEIPGWKIVRARVDLGSTAIETFTSPSDPTGAVSTAGSSPGTYTGDSSAATMTFTSSFVSGAGNLTSSSDTAVRLASTGNSTPYGIVRGPYLVSTSSVDLQAGDTVSFKWAASGTGDAYDVYAYLLNTSDGSTIQLLDGTGVGSSSTFATETKTVSAGQDGNYKFVFVSGTFDYSGGQALGGELYVDDVNVTFTPRAGVTSVLSGGTPTARTLTLQNAFDPGDLISFDVLEGAGTVATLTYEVTAENFTLNNDGTGGAIAADSDQALNNIATSIKVLYDAYAGVSDPTASVTNNVVTFSGTAVTLTVGQTNRPIYDRVVTFASDDVVEGNQIELSVGDKSYSVIVGFGDTSSSVASAFKEKLLPDYVGTATVSAGVLTLQPGAQVGDVDISVDVYQLEDSKNLGKISSTVSAVSSDPAVARQIEIADHDVYAGNRFELRVGNPEVSNTFSVIAGTNDSASTIATKLSNQLKSLYGDSAAGSSGATVTNGVITLTAGLNLGMSSISLGVNDMSPGVAVEAQSSVNAKTRDDRARTITISQSDLQIGNQVSVSLLGKTYSTTVTSLDDATTVAGKLASKLSEDFSAIDGVEQLVISGNQITFGTNARLGNDQIDVVVKQVSSSDSLTLSALGADGRVMDFQSISLGTVQSGSRSELRFDQMGVVITATNLSATSISGADVFESGLTGNSLVVGAVGSRAALVQVGGSANQNIVLDGFADIRLNGNNQGDAQYREVFDDLSDAIDLISTKSALALTEDNFGDLESLVEAAITSIAGARASLGVQQNRVEFAIANLLAQQSQLESARSQILDTDFAAETARLTRMQIGQQASTAMLAQANQLPNVILALLK